MYDSNYKPYSLFEVTEDDYMHIQYKIIFLYSKKTVQLTEKKKLQHSIYLNKIKER